jgi:hypothetical protein
LSKAVIPGRHLVGLESPTYSKGKFQEREFKNQDSILKSSPGNVQVIF